MVDWCDLSTKICKFAKDANRGQGARRKAESRQFGTQNAAKGAKTYNKRENYMGQSKVQDFIDCL
jgi:hypothetical protein